MLKGNEGFTLIESLLVMLCMSVFLLVPFFMVKKWKEEIEVDMFFNQLDRAIEKTHQSAIVEGQHTWILQDRNNQQFVFNYKHHQELRTEYLEVKEPLYLKTNASINFKSRTGNINGPDVIKIEDKLNKRVVHYTFQFGSGKVIKSEIKQ